MALKTYIGPDAEVDVVVAGNHIGTVRHGKGIFVPDDLANSVGWPETNWQDGAPEIEKPVKEKGVK